MVAHSLRETDFGTGLRAWELGVVLVLSVAIFLFWGGPLWQVPPGSSHVARIAMSYLAIVPLAAGALALGRRLRWGHLLSAVAVLWSAKLIITASIYAYLATGSASRYEPARTWESQPTAAPPAAREEPPSAPPRDHALAVSHARYDQERIVVTLRDSLVVENRDATLHTLRISKNGRTVRNLPLPAGGDARRIAIPETAGEYRLGCENHASEAALLVVGEAQ
jgi:hypothetical protein